ncbi:MAG: hypothetical protein J7L15_02455 [Clostridiales bacterium]|nr:hypothetical protein [Clostridiales bacterium]
MNFKNYLNEDAEILSEFTTHNIAGLISKYMIPLSPGMLDRLGYSENDKIAYHLTNFDKYFEDIYKNQGKKGQISCFTRGGFELSRVPSQPNILIKLKGKMIIGGNTDIWTVTSSRGVRWLDQDSRIKDNKLSFNIEGILRKLSKNYNIDFDELDIGIVNLSKKDQVSFYRDYMKAIERYLDQGGYKELNAYLKNAADMSYNEVIMERIEILEVSCVEIEQDYIIDKLNLMKVTYGGLKNYHDIKKIKD